MIGKTVEVQEYFLAQLRYSKSFFAFFFQITNIHIFTPKQLKNERRHISPMIHFPIIKADKKKMKKNGISIIPNKALKFARISDHHQSFIHPANTMSENMKQMKRKGKGTIHILGTHSVPSLFSQYPSSHSFKSGIHASLFSLSINPSEHSSPTYWHDPDIGLYSKGHSVKHYLSCSKNPSTQLVQELDAPEQVLHLESHTVQNPLTGV